MRITGRLVDIIEQKMNLVEIIVEEGRIQSFPYQCFRGYGIETKDEWIILQTTSRVVMESSQALTCDPSKAKSQPTCPESYQC